MACKKPFDEEAFILFADSELPAGLLKDFKNHIENCEECREELKFVTKTLHVFRTLSVSESTKDSLDSNSAKDIYCYKEATKLISSAESEFEKADDVNESMPLHLKQRVASIYPRQSLLEWMKGFLKMPRYAFIGAVAGILLVIGVGLFICRVPAYDEYSAVGKKGNIINNSAPLSVTSPTPVPTKETELDSSAVGNIVPEKTENMPKVKRERKVKQAYSEESSINIAGKEKSIVSSVNDRGYESGAPEKPSSAKPELNISMGGANENKSGKLEITEDASTSDSFFNSEQPASPATDSSVRIRVGEKKTLKNSDFTVKDDLSKREAPTSIPPEISEQRDNTSETFYSNSSQSMSPPSPKGFKLFGENRTEKVEPQLGATSQAGTKEPDLRPATANRSVIKSKTLTENQKISKLQNVLDISYGKGRFSVTKKSDSQVLIKVGSGFSDFASIRAKAVLCGFDETDVIIETCEE